MTDSKPAKAKDATPGGTTGAGDDKQGIAGKGSDQRPASHMERPGANPGGKK